MSTATAAAPITKLEAVSGRLRILQLLRTIALAQPNAESKRRLGELIKHPATDERLRALIAQMHSDNPQVREAVGLVLGEALNNTTTELANLVANGDPDAPAAETPTAALPAAPAQPAAAAAPVPATPREFANTPAPAAPVPVILDTPPAPVSMPLAGLANCEEVELQLPPVNGVEQPKLSYSIVRTDGPANADTLRGVKVSAVRGLVLGYKGQGPVVGGYGWVFPVESQAFHADLQESSTHSARLHLPIAMQYPQMLAYFDPHHLDATTSAFLAAHQLLKDGFRLLLRVDLVPYLTRIVATTQPGRFFDQFDAEGHQMAITTRALNNLEHGFADIEVIGVLLEVSHG